MYIHLILPYPNAPERLNLLIIYLRLELPLSLLWQPPDYDREYQCQGNQHNPDEIAIEEVQLRTSGEDDREQRWGERADA